MRVAYTLEQCWHRVPGGTATAAVAVAAELGALDDVEVIGVSARHRPGTGPALPIPIKALPLPRPLLYESWHALGRPRVEDATGPVDVVHATTLIVPGHRAPLVVTIHDLAWRHAPQHFTRRGVRFFERGLELTRRRAAVVLCSSEATRTDCLAAGIEPDRIRLVPLGVDPTRAGEDEIAAVRARHGLFRPYVAWCGTLEPRKNVPGLVAAFRRVAKDHPDLDLALVGPPGWGPDLTPLLDGLGGRVRALGYLDEADKRAVLAGASVVCQPSFREGFGLPVAEAMAQGTPVVTSAGTSTEEVAGGAAVLIDPHDVDSIAEGIRAVLENEAFAAHLRAAGLARAAELSWTRTAERTRDAYRQALLGV